jgi:hypothetical protein
LAGYKQYLPQITFSNINLNLGVPTLNTFQPNTTYMVGDVFSKSAGKHTWKFGGEFRYFQINERNFASPNGQFVFDGSVTGSDIADFLLGATSNNGGNGPYTQAAEQLLDSRPALGSEHAVLRYTREDSDLGSRTAVHSLSTFSDGLGIPG